MIENKSGFKRLLEIWSVFLKIGFLGFGGGSALIPVIKNQLVDKKKWFTEAEYLKHTIIAVTSVISICCIISIVVLMGYETLKDSKELMLIKRYILPVIGGMLISTLLSMVYETMNIIASTGTSLNKAFIGTILSVLLVCLINKLIKINDLIILIASGSISLTLLNLI